MLRITCQHSIRLLKTTLIGMGLLAILASCLSLWRQDLKTGLLDDSALASTQFKPSESSGFPLSMIDPTGEEFVLQEPPQRIVSVTLGTDEILSALVDHSRIIAVTNLVDEPSLSNITSLYPDRIQRISSEIEAIIALQPDLIFVAQYTRAETVRLLLSTGIPVIRLPGQRSFNDIKQNITTVARVTGSEPSASELLKRLENNKQAIEKSVLALKTAYSTHSNATKAKPRVLYYNLNGYTAGQNTLMNEMIEIAGGYNVIHDTGMKGTQKISAELAISLGPEIILMKGWGSIVDSNSGSTENETPAQELMDLPAWQNVPAVKNQRVYTLNGAWVSSVSQFSWLGIEEIAEFLHPALLTSANTQSTETPLSDTPHAR